MTRIFALFLLLLLPFPVLYYLSAKDRHYDEILSEIKDAQECNDQPCKIDFDDDATPGLLLIDRASPAEYYDSWLVATENGREILRLPHRRLDNTLRTHVGIRSEDGRTRLVVYDHMSVPGPPLNTVFAWNGKQLSEIHPSREDQEVLNAMHARDDAGAFTIWAAYRTLRIPTLTFYYILWGVCAWWIFKREKRKQLASSSSAEDQ